MNDFLIEWSEPFKKDFKKLSPDIQGLFEEKMDLLIKSRMAHPSLRLKKMKGTAAIWEGSITMNYRFTFQKTESGIFLRRIGNHDRLRTP